MTGTRRTTTATAAGTTTDSDRSARSFARISVRTRITAVIALLSTAAMAGAGILVYTLESARIERQTSAQIDQEIAEFRRLQSGVDPKTGEDFTDVGRLLDLFLTRNVPDDDEILLAYTDAAEEPLRTVNRNAESFLTDPDYAAAVNDLFDQGGTRVLETDAFGEVWVTVLPVLNETTQGALVIVSFLADEHDDLNQTMQTYAIVGLLSLGLLVLLASTQSGRLLAPLRTLRETANDITTTDLARRIPEQGNDDITALTRTFNMMLDRLEGGFVTQRQFLDDAGHELKTPLTVLRGHLELLDTASPDDVEETREILLEEVDRMARLVGDLILLAKTSRPDFVSSRATDVAALTETTLAKARALGDRTWILDAAAEVSADLDEQRVTQALLQLCDNAVKHTGPGDTIALGSSYDDAGVRLWVRDSGPGVPDADHGQIFERFGRGAVPDGDEGFGLGLSIVRAIAVAHGGSVHVEDAEPHGARFVLTLPVTAEPSRPASPTQTTEVP